MVELSDLSKDVKDGKLKDTIFQTKLEELYKHCDLPELLKLVNLDGITKTAKLPDSGAANLGVDLSKVEGLPRKLVFGKLIFGLKKGRSIVPHGHDNMCTGFIILSGTFTGKHYDRVEDNKDHYLIKPTIDRAFRPGECSTISDHKDNVHWFQCDSETGFIFNIHIMGYNPENKNNAARVYVDPAGEKTASGLIGSLAQASQTASRSSSSHGGSLMARPPFKGQRHFIESRNVGQGAGALPFAARRSRLPFAVIFCPPALAEAVRRPLRPCFHLRFQNPIASRR